ncbi:MAG: hypothetical protein MMC33_006018 [Icmadophila ericetorum]|nr:hypothetical protein [Icmadophila ericetorum]
MNTHKAAVHLLAPFDHVAPRGHVPKLLYFASAVEPEIIVSTLRNALTETLEALPILKGTVDLVRDGSEYQQGCLGIQAPYYTADEILSVKDLREKYDIRRLRAKQFPTNGVDPVLVTPDLSRDPPPVMLAQANLIQGGLLLVFAIHHTVMDEQGLFNVIRVWSAYCSGADGARLVGPDWTDRNPLVEGEGPGKLQAYPEYQLRPEESLGAAPAYLSDGSSIGTAVLFFSNASLEKLKKVASKSEDEVSGKTNVPATINGTENLDDTHHIKASRSWISTNDALCGLLWKSITAARSPTLAKYPPSTLSHFNMAVSGRSILSPPISPDYVGNVTVISKAYLPLSMLLSVPSSSPNGAELKGEGEVEKVTSSPLQLPSLASTIRKSISNITSPTIKDIIASLRSISNLQRLAPSGYNSRGTNIGCSSWARQPYYDLQWGSIVGGGSGNCERLRWRSVKTDGIFVILPKLPGDAAKGEEGGLEIILGLEREVLGRLLEDEGLREYAKWRCG